MAQNNGPSDPPQSAPIVARAIPGRASDDVPLQPPAPIAEQERIALVDVLRGLALFGILTVNMAFFSWPLATLIRPAPPWTTGADMVAHSAILWLFTGKFYVLFSFLFGLGMSIQHRRAEQRGAPFAGLFTRRLLVLLLIGIAHGVLIWMGDILACYATLGFGLLVFRLMSNRALLLTAAALLVAEVLLAGAGIALSGLEAPSSQPATAQASAETEQFFAHLERQALDTYPGGTFVELTAIRVQELLIGWGALASIAPQILALFALGLYAGRISLFEDPQRYRGAFLFGVRACLPVGLALNAVTVMLMPQSESLSLAGALALAFTQLIGGPVLTFGYVSVVALLFEKPGPRRVLAFLSPVGRMALSNYLLQSLVCTLFFYCYYFPGFKLGFGEYARWGPAAGFVLTLILFACQSPLSAFWLRHFRFGPMEWLWRSLTYLRAQPLRRARLELP